MHRLSPKTHGIIDYATTSAIMAAPKVLHMPKRAKAFTYGLAGGLTGLSLMTRNPTGAAKVVPWKGHGIADAMLVAGLPFVPRILGLKKKDKKTAQYFLCGVAGMIGLVGLMTDWGNKGFAQA